MSILGPGPRTGHSLAIWQSVMDLLLLSISGKVPRETQTSPPDAIEGNLSRYPSLEAGATE